MRIFVTGSAGFIGSNLVLRLLKTESPIEIVGFDSVNDYYGVRLKEYRLQQIDRCAAEHPESRYIFVKGNLADKALIDKLFAEYKFNIVVNLAAQAGVRYSIENPDAYIESNLIGFYNILEACRHSYENGNENYRGVEHLVYASSSSVYGGNKKVPFAETDMVDNPVSLYAATKNATFAAKFTDDNPSDVTKLQLIVSPSSTAYSDLKVNPSTGFAAAQWKYEKTFDLSTLPITTVKNSSFSLPLMLTAASQDLDVTVNALSATDEVLYTRTLTEVPFQPGHKTQATGTFFSPEATGTFSFDITEITDNVSLD